jgi:RsiW-degrading membrane proteinase PrsW (M82 family)
MTANIQLALLGALPAILAMLYFDKLDAKRPEPRSTLRKVALAGGLCAIPVVLIGELLKLVGPVGIHGGAGGSMATYAGALYLSFFVAAVPEEAAKMGSMLLLAWRRPEFDERMDGIVYGAWAGLGFALVENVLYLLLLPASFSEYVAVFIGRAVLAVPGHATWGAIMGYFAAMRRFDGRGPGLWGGYCLAVLLHGTYDAVVFCTPVAIARGHDWLSLGIGGIPIVAYAVPALIVGGSALLLRHFTKLAMEADDLAEAYGRLGSHSWPTLSPRYAPGGTLIAAAPPTVARAPGGTVITPAPQHAESGMAPRTGRTLIVREPPDIP